MMQWLDTLLARKSREQASVLEQIERDLREWRGGTVSTLTFSQRAGAALGMPPGRLIDPDRVERVLGRWRLKRVSAPQAEELIREMFEPVVVRTGGQHTPEVQT